MEFIICDIAAALVFGEINEANANHCSDQFYASPWGLLHSQGTVDICPTTIYGLARS